MPWIIIVIAIAIAIGLVIWGIFYMFKTHELVELQEPERNTQNSITIPTARISQAQAIQIVENDLKNRFSDFNGIRSIVYNDTYIPFSEFLAKNKELPLVYVHPNGTLIPIINGTHTFRGACLVAYGTYCAFLPPFSLDYKSRLMYGLDISYERSSMNRGTPDFYAVDAVSGDIVDSSFLRSEGRSNMNKTQ